MKWSVSINYFAEAMKNKLFFKKGKNLTQEELEIVNFWRKKEFNSQNLVTPRPGNDDWNKIYTLLNSPSNNILAFGRIHDVNLEFMGESYSVFGIATLIATVKGKGYGSEVLNGQLSYAEKRDKTVIGFCNKKLTEYYRKRGLLILEDGAERFLYKDDDDKLHENPWGGGDVIYINGKDNLMDLVIKNPEEKVISYRQHW